MSAVFQWRPASFVKPYVHAKAQYKSRSICCSTTESEQPDATKCIFDPWDQTASAAAADVTAQIIP